MILGRLLKALFEHGVVFVMTSNYPPDGLWPNGLQRERFLPTIALIKRWLDVVEVDAGIDYRLRALEQVSTYHAPAGPAADAALARGIRGDARRAATRTRGSRSRAARIVARRRRRQRRLVRLSRRCATGRARSATISSSPARFSVLLLSGVPRMTADMGDGARRFTWLVDILYDHRVKLLASAAAPAGRALPRGPNSGEFARTVSRLAEMQTRDYMARAARRGRTPARLAASRPSRSPSPIPSKSPAADKETPVQKFKAYRTFQEDDGVASRFVDMTLDELDPGDVVVRTKYSTINYKDALSYNGAGKIMRKYPTNAGIDMAGTVEIVAATRAGSAATRSSCTPTTWASRTTAAMPNSSAFPATGSSAAPRA